MDELQAITAFNALVNCAIDAKMKSIGGMVAGIEFVLAHMFNLLDQRGDAATRGALPATALEQRLIFHRAEKIIQTIFDPPPPEAPATSEPLRSRFRAIDGGLPE